MKIKKLVKEWVPIVACGLLIHFLRILVISHIESKSFVFLAGVLVGLVFASILEVWGDNA